MSGKLRLISRIKNINTIKSFLLPSDNALPDITDDENVGWDSDWGWEDVDISNSQASNQATEWLENIEIAISPVGDVIAMAKDARLVVLKQKFVDNSSDNRFEDASYFEESYRGEPTAHNERIDNISSVLCVPLSSLKKSSYGYPDWTCIVVGFVSGYVRFYEDNGGEIMSQLFHNKPVQKLRVKTFEPRRNITVEEQDEELNLLYYDVLVVVKGISLFQTLRASRNHLARAAAGGHNVGVDIPQLEFKKWGLHDQASFCDVVSPGVFVPTMFDRMVTASLLGGAYATVDPTPIRHNVYITAGKEPFLAFFFAAGGSWTPVLSDLAVAVAHKVKNALFKATNIGSWFGSSSTSKPSDNKTDEKQQAKLEPATTIPLRFGLPDKRREALSVVLSSDLRNAAVTDSFARVILVDVNRGCAVRVWKGYREAEVGFLEVEESDGEKRHVQYLVIYAPRRGILEVWTAQQGPRVAAFNVPNNGKLLHSSYKLVGLNNELYKSARIGSLHELYFLDAEGRLSILEIPFHLCLTDRNSHRSHDYLLIKQLRTLLKKHSSDSDCLDEEISDILRQFKLVGCLELCVERLLSTKYLSTGFVKSKLSEIIELLQSDMCCKYSSRSDKDRLIAYAHSFFKLFDTYAILSSIIDDLSSEVSPFQTRSIDEHTIKFFSDLLSMESEDTERCFILYENCRLELNDFRCRSEAEDKLPKLLLPNEITGLEFIDWFYCYLEGRDQNQEAIIKVAFPTKISHEKKTRMGRFFFESCLYSPCNVEYAISSIRESIIPAKMLLSALINYLLSQDRCFFEETEVLKSIFSSLLSLRENELLSGDEFLEFMSELRLECVQSCYLSSVLILAVVVRVGLLEHWQNIEKHSELLTDETMDCDTASESKTSSLTERMQCELSEWHRVCSRVEDLLRLQLLLRHSPPDVVLTSNTPALQVPNPAVDLCLNRVVDAGRGVLSEVLGRWAVRWRRNVQDVEALYRSLGKDLVDDDSRKIDNRNLSRTEELFKQVYEHLPNSLEFDSVLANIVWENIVAWSKDMEDVGMLSRAVDFLGKLGPGGAMIVHGLGSMIWDMHLMKLLQNTTYLLDKEQGKIPGDRKIRKELGLGESALITFLQELIRFMRIFISACENAEVVPAFGVEDQWKDIGNRLSLVELAVDRPTVNVALLKHHQQLAECVGGIFLFRIRNVRPLSLFDTRGVQCLFKSLTSRPILPNDIGIDLSVENRRYRFLDDLLTGSVCKGLQSSSLQSRSSDDPYLYSEFVKVTLNLGELWHLDLDRIHRMHVVALCRQGCDSQAELLISKVKETGHLATELMLVVGQRLGKLCFPDNEEEDLNYQAMMTPTLTTWIRSTNFRDVRCPSIDMSSTQQLMSLVMRHLPDNCAEYRIALQLDEFIHRISSTT